MAKNFIKSAIKKPGALHRSLGVKQGSKIPLNKIRSTITRLHAKAQRGKLSSSDSRLLKRANFALTLKKFNK